MKSTLLIIVTAVTLIFFPKINFGQVINLGPDAAKFVLFTSSGAVGDNASAHSHITGDVGTLTPGPITGFGNVNGVMHPGVDAATTACGIALAATIAQINSNPATLFPSSTMGSGVIFTPGIYSIPGNATLTLDLILDGQGDPNAEFVIKIQGTFGANTNSKVKLINGALACHVFWYIDGAVSMASLATMRGNIINGGAILMGSGDSLEGRAFTTVGAISIDGITAFTPIGCNSPYLTGPHIPNLASAACYTIFASTGALDGNLSSTSIGDVGSNGGGTVTGWTAGNVTGTLHTTQDPSTIQCAIDVLNLYDTLNAMPYDIELLYPVQFGHNLVLTPHVYLMNSGGPNGPATLTDSLYLDAQGNANGVFVIKIIGGALTTSTYSKVKLINGAQSKNVFWLVQGAVSINNYSVFRGTIVISAGALNLVNTGVVLDGRALTVNGAITTGGLAASMPLGSGASITTEPSNQTACIGSSMNFSVVASGTGLTYQWRKGTVNLTDSANISGATSDTLKINPVSISDTAFNYNVVITGACSSSDTSINVSLTVNPVYITNNPQTICNGGSYVFNGHTYTLAGNYNDTLSAITACDSIIITQLTVNPVYSTNNPQIICNGGSYVFNGHTYILAGNYNDTLSTINGCDSIIVTQLTVNPVYSTNNPQTICNGNSYVFNGHTYTIAANYNDTLTTVNGCDSIIVTQLTVNPVYSTNNPQTICNGNSYVFNGNTYILTGNYNDTLSTVNGCDSIIVTQLTVNPVYSINNPQTICNGNSYVFNGNTYTLTGNYNDTLSTVNGCDSIIVTQLTVDSILVAVATSNSPVCIGSSINLTAQTVQGGTYLWTGVNGYSSTVQNSVILSASAADAGNYSLVVSANGCTSAPSAITIIVNSCDVIDFNIPEGFSPNGDGVNDLFVIRGIERYPANTFVIFNRWGDKVFEASNYQNKWDGKTTMGLRVGGDDLPIGTYFYVLDLHNGSDIYKGTIYLNR